MGPLEGIRIVDLSAIVSGPLATTHLADQGAEVVKVEPRGIGDLLRWLGSNRGGMSGLFHLCNRGKRSITLDLRQEAGKDVLCELVKRADVLVQNFRPGVAERMGIGWDQLRIINPNLIYVSISGFGPTGPWAHERVYDNVIQVTSGFAAAQTDQATGTPQLIRQVVCDKITALNVAQAISAALFARERKQAGGQHIQIAMLDAAIAFLWPDMSDDILLGEGIIHTPPLTSAYQMLPVADGWGTVTVISDSEFRGLCRAFDHEEIADDPRFTTMSGRIENSQALILELLGKIIPVLQTLTRDQVEERLHTNDVPGAGVRSIREVPELAQVLENGTFVESEHPLAGRLREPRPAPRFETTPARCGGPAPSLGQHSEEILRELGLGERIESLRAAAVI